MAINQRLKRVFDNLEFSQVHFSEMVGTRQSILSRILSGKVGMSIDIMQNLHNKFHINLNWLICGSGKMYIKDYGNANEVLNEPSSSYSSLKDIDIWKDAIKAKDELIEMQKNEIKRLKEKCGETDL